MACDIHSFAETRNKKTGVWTKVSNAFTPDNFYETDGSEKVKKSDHPFSYRSYGLFGFLAGVRNYSECKPLSMPRGVPSTDMSRGVWTEYMEDADFTHSASYLTLRELIKFDYDQTFWDKRVEREIRPGIIDCAATAMEGEGEIVSYKDFLGELFFTNLSELKKLGKPDDVRIVFWFDN